MLILGIAGSSIAQVTALNPRETLIVDIDIRPSTDPNKINCKSTNGSINIAVFSDSNFVAKNIDVSTLKLEDKSVTEIHGKVHLKNLDGNGDRDALVHLNKVDVCNAISNLPVGKLVPVTLTGLMTDEQQFEGTDTIKINSPKPTEDPSSAPPTPTPAGVEAEIHRLINEERTKAGVQPLQWSARLSEIAEQHSTDMRDKNYFSHGNFVQRIRTVCGGAAGENIFYGFGTDPTTIAKSAVTAWMNSAGHRANILASIYHSEGVGIAISENNKVYVTQDFCQ